MSVLARPLDDYEASFMFNRIKLRRQVENSGAAIFVTE